MSNIYLGAQFHHFIRCSIPSKSAHAYYYNIAVVGAVGIVVIIILYRDTHLAQQWINIWNVMFRNDSISKYRVHDICAKINSSATPLCYYNNILSWRHIIIIIISFDKSSDALDHWRQILQPAVVWVVRRRVLIATETLSHIIV